MTARSSLQAAFLTAMVGALLLSGCASPQKSDPGARSTPSPDVGGMLTTHGAVTVLDDGTGAQLCLGAIATSLPPQCGGPEIIGWDWADWPDSFTAAAGVRWGDFALTGLYDAAAFTFTPADVRPWRDDDEPTGDGVRSGDADFTTPCDAPDGGWHLVDESRTTDETMNSTFERAARLPGYATSWVDRSRVPEPAPDATSDEQLAGTASFPELTIVNVKVVGDVAAAETELRRIWGGMLCVTEAERTDAELQTIVQALMTDHTGLGILTGGIDGRAGVVEVSVIHDDGTLQRRMDDEYGAGIVDVTSALQPVD